MRKRKSGTVKHLVNILHGMRAALVLFPDSREYRVERNGFAADARALRGDFATVSDGLSKGLKIEPPDYRAR